MRPREGRRIEIETHVERNTYSHALMQPCSRLGTITLQRYGYSESRVIDGIFTYNIYADQN